MLKVCHLNIRSLPKHFHELRHWSDIVDNDVICLSESWLNNSHYNSTYLLPGYALLRRDRGEASRAGGLATSSPLATTSNFKMLT